MAVKDYMLSNSYKYNAAIKKTGPIDGASLYRRTQHIKNDRSGNSRNMGIVNMEDPYWAEFFERNMYHRATQWKLPSSLAWDHKKFGILEDVFGAEKMKEIS